MNWKNNNLQILGLNETETNILNTLDDLKNVQQIARDSGVSRTGINYTLKSLIRKGFVNYRIIGKRRSYIAISHNQLIEKIKQALDQVEIRNTNKKGVRVKTSPEDEFIIHVGAKEIIPAYNRIAVENKNERVRAIQHHRSWNELIRKISPTQLVAFNEEIKKNHLIIDGMLNQSAYDAYRREIQSAPEKNKSAIKSLEGRMADYTVFPDEFFDHDAEIWIFKATTLIINWREEVAIEITNANMTFFLKDMFEFVKAGGKKLDHNQAMKELLEN
jgi:sugar-specific transcriptional regulator TrmB